MFKVRRIRGWKTPIPLVILLNHKLNHQIFEHKHSNFHQFPNKWQAMPKQKPWQKQFLSLPNSLLFSSDFSDILFPPCLFSLSRTHNWYAKKMFKYLGCVFGGCVYDPEAKGVDSRRRRKFNFNILSTRIFFYRHLIFRNGGKVERNFWQKRMEKWLSKQRHSCMQSTNKVSAVSASLAPHLSPR